MNEQKYETKTAAELQPGDRFAVIDPDGRWPERPATVREVEAAEARDAYDQPAVSVRLHGSTVILTATQPVKVYR